MGIFGQCALVNVISSRHKNPKKKMAKVDDGRRLPMLFAATLMG